MDLHSFSLLLIQFLSFFQIFPEIIRYYTTSLSTPKCSSNITRFSSEKPKHIVVGIISRLSFFFQAEDGIRDRSPSRGLGDVYKRQIKTSGRPEKVVAVKATALALSSKKFGNFASGYMR